MTDNSNLVSIRHMVVEDSSKLVIGRNLTRRYNIEYIGTNSIHLQDFCPTEKIKMREYGHKSHIYVMKFIVDDKSISNNSLTILAIDANKVMYSATESLESMNW